MHVGGAVGGGGGGEGGGQNNCTMFLFNFRPPNLHAPYLCYFPSPPVSNDRTEQGYQ